MATAEDADATPVRMFKSLAVALKELERFIRNGRHLQVGDEFKNFGGMRSRELLGNWLLCVVGNYFSNDRFTFASDPLGGDGLIVDDQGAERFVGMMRRSGADALQIK